VTRQSYAFSATDLDQPSTIDLPNGEAVAFTHKAPEKKRDNEDSLAIIELDDAHCVLAVADGLGGLPEGAAASKIVVDSLVDGLNDKHLNAIEDIVKRCNNILVAQDIGNATTLSVAEVRNDTLLTYQVGDSSVWVIGQQGKPKFRSPVHSPVGEAVAAGKLSEIDALLHRERNLVSNVIGSIEMYVEHCDEFVLAPRDTVLVASDGLFDNLFEDEIIEIVRKGPLLDSARELIDKASERMAQWPSNGKTPAHPDDLSFILYRAN